MLSKKLTINKPDCLRNNLLNNTFYSKNDIDNKTKTFEKQPYSEYINLNSYMNNMNNQISLAEYTLSTSERTRNNKDDNNSKEFTTDKNNSQLNIVIKNKKSKSKSR